MDVVFIRHTLSVAICMRFWVSLINILWYCCRSSASTTFSILSIRGHLLLLFANKFPFSPTVHEQQNWCNKMRCTQQMLVFGPLLGLLRLGFYHVQFWLPACLHTYLINEFYRLVCNLLFILYSNGKVATLLRHSNCNKVTTLLVTVSVTVTGYFWKLCNCNCNSYFNRANDFTHQARVFQTPLSISLKFHMWALLLKVRRPLSPPVVALPTIFCSPLWGLDVPPFCSLSKWLSYSTLFFLPLTALAQ